MEHEVSDGNEWFKDVKRLIRGLEVETVEDPFACPTVKSVTDGEDVLHALGLHPSRDVCGIVNVDIDEVYGLIRHIEPEPVTGSTSDGYHTFDELYHHRAVLFSVIVAMFRGRSWKSLHHHDGTMYDGMFIVGIDTPAGPATYHYDVEPYWDMFPCEVLDRAPDEYLLGAGVWRACCDEGVVRVDDMHLIRPDTFGALMNDIEAALACPSSEEPTHAYNVVSGMCDACADRCGGTLCQSMALHNICNRIHSLLAGDGE